ncbi:hypothetical protein GCM10010517_49030 [Streptosporangium fragile]|uniref:Polysaccharide deacetylase n=2 Tax=Streptosporangium fragile TaxID=46186 RepID=A0ABN3W2I5_9ACTN
MPAAALGISVALGVAACAQVTQVGDAGNETVQESSGPEAGREPGQEAVGRVAARGAENTRTRARAGRPAAGAPWCPELAGGPVPVAVRGQLAAPGSGRCRLRPGERPPQFVVISFDGAGVDSQGWFPIFRQAARRNRATLTFFLSGVYLLPEDRRHLYDPPRHPRGTSRIGFQRRSRIAAQAAQLGAAWREGHEIGSHFNGHFCGAGGVRTWTADDWRQELEQFYGMVERWRENASLTHLPDLPFRIRDTVIGGRTPCLEGDREQMFQAFSAYGWRYDASGIGWVAWPGKRAGLWQFPIPSVTIPGTRRRVLGMDYDFFTLHSGAKTRRPHMWSRWKRQTVSTYVAAVQESLAGDRAPVFIGNHFESWNGGIYMRALISLMDEVCTRDEVRCVSFEQLADWLDAQDPGTVERLRARAEG